MKCIGRECLSTTFKPHGDEGFDECTSCGRVQKRMADTIDMKDRQYIGIHGDRLDGKYSEIEKALVDEWQRLHDRGPGYTNFIESLFCVYCDEKDPEKISRWKHVNPHPIKFAIGPPTARDKIVAETIIQWLGTNCGREFLRQCGFVRVDGR